MKTATEKPFAPLASIGELASMLRAGQSSTALLAQGYTPSTVFCAMARAEASAVLEKPADCITDDDVDTWLASYGTAPGQS